MAKGNLMFSQTLYSYYIFMLHVHFPSEDGWDDQSAAVYTYLLSATRYQVLHRPPPWNTSMKMGSEASVGDMGLILCVLLFLIRVVIAVKKRWGKGSKAMKFICFFHPHCSNGGGGERVLWLTICSLLRDRDTCNDANIVIYSGDSDPDEVSLVKCF